MQPLLTAEQLAPLLGVGIEQVRKLTREGALPHHRIGGAIRYDLEAVKAATRTAGPDAEKVVREMIRKDAQSINIDMSAAEMMAGAKAMTLLSFRTGSIDANQMVELLHFAGQMVKDYE